MKLKFASEEVSPRLDWEWYKMRYQMKSFLPSDEGLVSTFWPSPPLADIIVYYDTFDDQKHK
jgi:hypothetical protein